MTLLWTALLVSFALYASAIVGDSSSDVTGAPVSAVREKRYIVPFSKCPLWMVQTLSGCEPAGKAFDRTFFNMRRKYSPRIPRTRAFRRRVRQF